MSAQKLLMPGAALALVLALAACAEKTPPGANLVINAFHGGEKAGEWQKANLQRYASSHNDLTPYLHLFEIYNDPVVWNLRDRVTAAPPPDVISAPIAGAMRDLAAQGKLTDLTELWHEQGWDDKFPASVAEMSSLDGKRYFVPQAIQWNPIFFRRDVFEKLFLQPPTTWDGFLQTCKTLDNAGYIPITISTRWSPPVARWFSILNMRLNGPRFHEELMRGRAAWNDPRVRKTLEFWQALFDHHCFVESTKYNDYPQAFDQLAQGKAAMWLTGEWLFEEMPPNAATDIDFFAFPTIDPALPRGEIAHVYGAFIPIDAAHPSEAREYLAYLGGKVSQTSMAETLNRLASRIDVGGDVLQDRHLQGRDFLNQAEHLTPLFEYSTDRRVAKTALQQFVRFWKNRNKADSVLNRIESTRREVYGGDS